MCEKLWRRCLALLLAIIMAFAMIPTQAFASEVNELSNSDVESGSEESFIAEQTQEENEVTEENETIDELETEIVSETDTSSESDDVSETDTESESVEQITKEMIQAQIDAVVAQYEITNETSDDEIAEMIEEADEETLLAIALATEKIEEDAATLTDEEVDEIAEDDNTVNYVRFCKALDLKLNKEVTVPSVMYLLDEGIIVKDSEGTGVNSDGVVRVTATGELFSKNTNVVEIINNTDIAQTVYFEYSAKYFDSLKIAGNDAAASGTCLEELEAGESITVEIKSNSGIDDLTAALTLDCFELIEEEADDAVLLDTPVCTEHNVVEDEEVPATCISTGLTSGSHCSVCGTVIKKQSEIDALGHNIEQVDSKIATYTAPGHDAYEYCTRCSYSTKVEIPMLKKPGIRDYDTFILNLSLLEEIASEYVRMNPGKDPVDLVIKYIRTGVDRYNSGSWNIMAGYEDAGFAEFVNQMEDMLNCEIGVQEEMLTISSLKDIYGFEIPNGNNVDFGHMFGTMDITYNNNFSVNHADVAGWAGDLVDLATLADRHSVSGTVEEMLAEISEKYLCVDMAEDDTFGRDDMYGDLDGFYIMTELKKIDYHTGDFTAIFINYFTEDLTDEQRADYLLKNRFGGVTKRDAIREAVYNQYTGNKVVTTLESTRTFETDDLPGLRRACCYSFADYLCELAGDYVEINGNDYYTVFSSEYSNLAPGITQEIHTAYTADDKQIKYYIATADINSEYVNVYANYKDNDPTSWGMQRVTDQVAAAQAKYGDPESEHYIENYQAIVGINGAGYNMTTGEPSGLLVMNGVEYQKPNNNGFFGILKNGKAVIGTTDEYYEMKDQVKEGIAAFGSTLVKDGKISVSASGSYYDNRASRTAVGITRTGKVVFMVLDGRQEPVSCGGSMEEIAQIMLEAGCVDAVNLDGGGSTTFAARQEGDDKVTLVNNPSDGFERSVSTSLLMVSTAPSSTAFDHAIIDCDTAYMTVGTELQLTASGVSATGNAAQLPEGTRWAVSDSRWGTITEGGLLTAHRIGDIEVNLLLGDTVIGSKTIHCVIPNNVYFSRENIDIVYGESVELPVVVLYDGKSVLYNDNDIILTVANETAGTVNGRVFTAATSTEVRKVTVTATLAADPSIENSMTVSLYNQGEATFDFDQATGGNHIFAWDRQVSNSTTEDTITYISVDTNEDMVTSYTFAIDMTQIPLPEQLNDLIYMLPGADSTDASAWNFLLQLAERVSVLTEVRPEVYFDPNFDVDISELTIVNEYFTLQDKIFDEETNKLTLVLKWVDQTQAIDPATANPLCILSGIKLTPKEDAQWDSNNRLVAVNSGEIGYTVYLRANALFTFASKPENQEIYGLKPFDNQQVIIGGATEKGGYFESVYATFTDTYTLINALKNGWVSEVGGYSYYKDGVMYTGVREVDGYYYDFGENGVCAGQNKYNGIFIEDGITHYVRFGVLSSGWVSYNGELYCFDENGEGYDGIDIIVDEVVMSFDNGKLLGGYSGFTVKSDGKTYYYVDGVKTYGWRIIDDKLYHFNTGTGAMTTGTRIIPDAEAEAKGAYYDFADNGVTLRGYFNPAGYYYWAGLPKIHSWVKAGADPDPEAWYRTNSHGHFVTDSSGKETFELELGGKTYTAVRIAIDGVVYTFNNKTGKLLLGDIVVNADGTLSYYWAGEPIKNTWLEYKGYTYYAFEDGTLATGSVEIDGTPYMFTESGRLVTDGVILIVTMNDDKSVMTIKTSDVEDVQSVRFAVWPANSSQSETLQWLDGTMSEDGEWYVDVPMCLYNIADKYNIHTYATFNDGNYGFLVNTVFKVESAVGHNKDSELKENVIEATCTTDGSYDSILHCSICDKEMSRETVIVKAEGHKAGEVVVENKVDATCTADGSYDNVTYCTVCNEEVSRETVAIKAEGHKAGEVVVENKVDATCTADGSYDNVTYCTVCDVEVSRETVTIKAEGHKAGEVVVKNKIDVTCTTDGRYDNITYCTVCDKEVSRETITIKAEGHKAGEVKVENKVDVTCTTDGSYDNATYCTVCDKEVSRETITIKAEGHKAGDVKVENKVDVTCTTDGSYDNVTYCTVCDGEVSRETVTIKAEGHMPGATVKENEVKATCTVEGFYDTVEYCAVCDGEISRVKSYVKAIGHVYSDDKDTSCNVCGESREEAIRTIPMYRLFNPNSGEHFYTGSVEERDMLVGVGWNYEGVAWNAPVTTGEPVYRLFNPNSGDHHYTMSAQERDNLIVVGWIYEGVAWNSATPDNVPLYRLYNPNAYSGIHHYTGSIEERDMLVGLGWIYEGIAWYGMLK